MTQRRGKGEGSIHAVHSPTCPPANPDGTRPRHACQRPRYRWQIDLGYVAGRRRRPTGTAPTKRQAQADMEAARQQLERGILPDHVTTGEWLQHWFEQVADLKPTTRRSYQAYLRTWLTPGLGHIELQKLRPDHIRALQATMRDQGKSDTTIAQANAILKSALQVAVDEQRVERNVAKLTTPKVRERRTYPILTLEQAQAVITAAPDLEQKVRCALALMVGLRQGEALGLMWDDVHLDADTPYLAIEWASVRINGGYTRQRPKSAASRRKAPLVPGVAALLALWQAEHGGEGYVFPGSAPGEPRNPRADWQRWTDTLVAAGVPHVPLHGARGTAGTFLVEQDVSILAVSAFLGHSDVKVTADHYAHVTERLRLKPMQALEAMLGAEQGPRTT